MTSLARVSLVRGWRRYSPTVLVVGFAGLLVLMQGILRLESFRTVLISINRAAVDLWLGRLETRSIDHDRDIFVRKQVLLSSRDDFPMVESALCDSSDLRRIDGSVALTAADHRALHKPDTVHVETSRLANLSTPAPPLLFP